MDNERPQVWDALPGEPYDAHAAFARFLDTDGSLRAFAAQSGHSVSQVQRWGAQWRWLPRRAAYLAHLRACAQSAAEEEAEEVAREHVRAARLLREWAMSGLEAMHAHGLTPGPQTMLRALKQAIDIERLIGGQPTARIDMDAPEVPSHVLAAIEALFGGEVDVAIELLGEADEDHGSN